MFYYGKEFLLSETVTENCGSTIINNIMYFKVGKTNKAKIYKYNIETDEVSEYSLDLTFNNLYSCYIVGHTSNNELCVVFWNESGRYYEMYMLNVEANTRTMARYNAPTSSAGYCGSLYVDHKTDTIYLKHMKSTGSSYYEFIFSRPLNDTTSEWNTVVQCQPTSTKNVSPASLTPNSDGSKLYWLGGASSSGTVRFACFDISTGSYTNISSDVSSSVTWGMNPVLITEKENDLYLGYCYNSTSLRYYSQKTNIGTTITSSLELQNYGYKNMECFQIDNYRCLATSNISGNAYLSKCYNGMVFLSNFYKLSSTNNLAYATFLPANIEICNIFNTNYSFMIILDVVTGEFHFFNQKIVGNHVTGNDNSDNSIFTLDPVYTTKNTTLLISSSSTIIIN